MKWLIKSQKPINFLFILKYRTIYQKKENIE